MKFEIIAQQRGLQGRGASRRLRQAGKVPAIVYGGTQAPQAIELDHNKLLINLRKENFRSSLLKLNIDGKEEDVLLRDLQLHAYKIEVLHVDFQRVDTSREMHIKVPLRFLNEDIAPGVKLSGGMVNHVMTEIEVVCMAADLPGFIEVDLVSLEIGQNIHVSQLSFPKGVKPLVHGEDDPMLVTIVSPAGGVVDEETTEDGEAAAEPPAA